MKQNDWGIANLILRPNAVRLNKKSYLLDKLDPYLIISSSASDEKIKTDVATTEKGVRKWNSAYSMRIYPDMLVIDLSCYDHDKVTKDGFIGTGTAYINRVAEVRYIDKTISLSSNGQHIGEVDIEMEYYADDDEEDTGLYCISESVASMKRLNQNSDIIMDDDSSIIKSVKYGKNQPVSSTQNVLAFNINEENNKQTPHPTNKEIFTVHPDSIAKEKGTHNPHPKQFVSTKQLSTHNISLENDINSQANKSNDYNPLAFDLKSQLQNQVITENQFTNSKQLLFQSQGLEAKNTHNDSNLAKNPLNFNFVNEYHQKKRTNSELFVNMLNQSQSVAQNQVYKQSMVKNKQRKNILNQPFDLN